MNIKKYWSDFKKFNFGLFIALCCSSLIPAIYNTVRTIFLSTTISVEQFDIIGQMEWFDLINETLLAFLIIPLYSLFNKIFTKDKENFAYSIFKTGLISLIIYTIFSLIIYIHGESLIISMNVAKENIEQTQSYLKLETIAFTLGFVVSFINVVFIVIGQKKNIYILLITRMILTIIGDFIFIPKFGVNGVGISNIVINGILSTSCIIILLIQKQLKICRFKKSDLKYGKLWIKEGLFSGFQSFIDNFIYIIMIAKMVNIVQEQGNYWVANNFIWSWLLIPVLALGEVIKQDCKNNYAQLKQSNYYIIIIFISILWIVSIPLWPLFFQKVEQLKNWEAIFKITINLFGFYIVYALTIIPDSIFIGMGKMKYSFINSIIVNIFYYGIFFLLYKINVILMSINTIILMFGFGMVVHEFISIIEEKIFFKKKVAL